MEINHAARKRFKPKVEELQAALKSNEGTFQQYKEKLDSHKWVEMLITNIIIIEINILLCLNNCSIIAL